MPRTICAIVLALTACTSGTVDTADEWCAIAADLPGTDQADVDRVAEQWLAAAPDPVAAATRTLVERGREHREEMARVALAGGGNSAIRAITAEYFEFLETDGSVRALASYGESECGFGVTWIVSAGEGG